MKPIKLVVLLAALSLAACGKGEAITGGKDKPVAGGKDKPIAGNSDKPAGRDLCTRGVTHVMT